MLRSAVEFRADFVVREAAAAAAARRVVRGGRAAVPEEREAGLDAAGSGVRAKVLCVLRAEPAPWVVRAAIIVVFRGQKLGFAYGAGRWSFGWRREPETGCQPDFR